MSGVAGIAERAFFREEFRRRTVVIAVGVADVETVAPVIGELCAGDSRVLIVVAADDAPQDPTTTVVGALEVPMTPYPRTASDLASLWTGLTETGLGIVDGGVDHVASAADLAGRLRVFKLVVIDAGGGWGRSFASSEDVANPVTVRPQIATAIRGALDAGVGGVNVCRAEDLDVELFTFDGAGTLFSSDAYVRVADIVADELPVVEQLVARGVAEGFLRPRTRNEVIRLALGGLGARVGPDGSLAGFGALEVDRYRSSQLAEVTCLYTVNRYAGEGVGGRLVEGLADAARRRGVRAVFACTVSERAAQLFRRCGFSPVPHDRLPPEKWVDYDPQRRASVSAHWLDLRDAGRGDPGGEPR